MKYLIILLVNLACNVSTVIGQPLGHIWYSGSSGMPVIITDYHGGNVLDFFSDTVNIYREYREMNFAESHVVKSNAIGEVDFYSNGHYIANANNDTLPGGAGLNPGFYGDQWATDKLGYRLRDGIIMVPEHNLPNHFRLFHTCISDNIILPDQILSTLIDLDGDSGMGAVVEKNVLIHQNKERRLSQSHFNAVCHANGRDWWLVNIYYESGDMLLHLYTPDSIFRMTKARGFDYEALWDDRFAVGQCQFSPDGTKFATAYVRRKDMIYQASIEYYKFNRCSGAFIPVFYEESPDIVSQHGVSFSADSRYLYQSNMNYLMRYDTEAADVFATKDTIAEWDGYHWNPIQGQNWPTRLAFSELGPDGNIYLHTSATTPYMHKILHPSNPDSTEVVQHFRIPGVNGFTIANYPSYTLGAVDGPCAEMLGPPTALFEWSEADVLIAFTDNSAGVPLTWHWDFGEGGVSEEQHPEHGYSDIGTYIVCLTVSNVFGSDMQCQEIEVTTTSVHDPLSGAISLQVRPNPASGLVEVILPEGAGRVVLMDIQGRKASEATLQSGYASMNVSGLPSGVYTVRVMLTSGQEFTEKLIVR